MSNILDYFVVGITGLICLFFIIKMIVQSIENLEQ